MVLLLILTQTLLLQVHSQAQVVAQKLLLLVQL